MNQESLAASLRFANGDLLIKLSDDTSLDLLLHKDVVAQHCPPLAPGLRSRSNGGQFDNSVQINMPDKLRPDPTNLFTLGLKEVDDTLVLEGTEFHGVPHNETCNRFDRSKLADGEWPSDGYGPSRDGLYANQTAALQYMIIFKIIYGMGFHFEDTYSWSGKFMWADMSFLSELCARAEFHGCLAQVSEAVLRKLLTRIDSWKFVAQEPSLVLLLAVKLRSREMYFDAIRHIVADPEKRQHQFLADYLDMNISDLTSTIDTLLAEQANTVSILINDLRRLQLVQVNSKAYGGGPEINETTFMNSIRMNGPSRTPEEQNSLNVEFFTRSFWGEFLVQQQLGHSVRFSVQNTRRGREAGPLNDTLVQIGRLVAIDEPLMFFGPRIAHDLAAQLCLGSNAVSQIQRILCQILQDADQITKNAFQEKEYTDENGKTVTYRRAHYDGNGAYLDRTYWTYFPWDETKVPWKANTTWPDAPTQSTAGLDMWSASARQLKAVGIDPNANQSEEAVVDWGEIELETDPDTNWAEEQLRQMEADEVRAAWAEDAAFWARVAGMESEVESEDEPSCISGP